MGLMQADKPLLPNGDFQNGLSGWKIEGKAKVKDGKLVLGPGKASVGRRYDVPGLRILWFGATLKPEGSEGKIRLRCFDKGGKLLMDLDGGPNPKDGAAAIYLKTPWKTAYAILGIEKGEKGILTADDAVLKDDDRNRVEHAPTADLDAYIVPFWTGETVVDETVLLLSVNGEPFTGRLLFAPSEIVSVKDSALGTTYHEGKDYALDGATLTTLADSGIPTMRDTEFAKGEFPWTETAGRHVKVTYRHTTPWTGPLPRAQGDRLPRTAAKLKAGKHVTAVAYGDSITLGINVSGFIGKPPFAPPWPALTARRLGENVTVVNMGLGGMTSQWAKDNARDAVANLKPDLVLVAFGMNDFWSLTPEQFAENIRATLDTIRETSPQTEFLLIAPMKFDPAYTAETTYVENLGGYAGELAKMAGPGVAFLDMTAISDAMYRIKGAKSLTTDPMHPDDFLARVYAQGVAATLAQP